MASDFKQKNTDASYFYSHVFNHVNDLVILLNEKGYIIDINIAAKKYYNWIDKEIIGKNFESLKKEIISETILPSHQSILPNINLSLSQISISAQSDLQPIIDWSTIELKDHENKISGCVIIGKDITDKIKTESQAQQIQAYLENISSCMPGNFYWKNKEGRYLGCNLSLVKTLRLLSVKDVVGKTDYDLWPKQAELLKKHDEKVMNSGQLAYLEEIVDMPSQGKMYFTVIKMPFFNEKGEIVGIIGNSLDITELKNTQSELEKAKEIAENLSKAKSEFIANMSHDVKTPIAGIIGLSEILKKQLQGAPQDFIQDIFLCAEQLMRFFDNCLEMAKSENMDMVLVKERFNFKVLVNQIKELFLPALENKNLDFSIDYDSKIPNVLLGSRPALYRIILNLLGNAVKFTEQGNILIKVDLSRKSTEKKAIIKLVIEDTGIGIPKDKQQIIFEQFTRLTPAYQGIYTGSGIGLFVVNKLVNSLNGEIYVESEEGKGSRFIVVLPLEIPLLEEREYGSKSPVYSSPQESPTHKVHHTPVELIEPVDSLNHKPHRILLVEDSKIAQQVGKAILSALNCNVEIAESGHQAIEMFQPGKYDLVLMDMGLPDTTGDKVAKYFREKEKESSNYVPIIALTAHPMKAVSESCKEANMQGVLSKPLSSGQASQIIHRYIYGQSTTVNGLDVFNDLPQSNSPKEDYTSLNNISASVLSAVSLIKNGLGKDLPHTEAQLFQLEQYPLLDIEKGLEATQNESALRQMLYLLIEEIIPQEISILENYYMNKDWGNIEKIAHKLKGGSLYCGTVRMGYGCQYLERYYKAGHRELLEKLYKQFRIVLKQTTEHIEKYLKQSSFLD